MPEDTGTEDKEGQAAGSGRMISGRGWLVVGAVVVLEAVFFSLVFMMKQGDPKKDDHISNTPGDTIEYITAYNVDLKQFNQSVISSGSQMLTLAMDMRIRLSRTQAEVRDDKKPDAEDMRKFQAAVQALEGDIRHMLVERINTMNYALLTKPEGKHVLASAVKDFVNRKLSSLNLQLTDDSLDRNRVQEVLVTQFILQ